MSAAAIPALLCLYGFLCCVYLVEVKKGTPRKDIAIVLGTLLMGVLRFSVPGHGFSRPGHGFSWPGSYEALTHTGCGVLVCLAWQRNWLALKALLAALVLEGVMYATC